MIVVKICIGSSCYLKGSQTLVELFQRKIAAERLENHVELQGSLCVGKCNREGVSIAVNEEIITGVRPEGFDALWHAHIAPKLGK